MKKRKNVGMYVWLPKDLLEEIDALVGKENRAKFMTDVVVKKLAELDAEDTHHE